MSKVSSTSSSRNMGHHRMRTTVDDNPRRYAKVIKGEIHNVLSVMRSLLSPELDEVMITSEEVYETLLSSLLQVNESLECNQFHPDKLYSYLSPFVMVIVSPDIGATLTGICINSLHKFVLYGILKEYTIVTQCIQQVTFFSGEAQEEMVVLKLLALSRLVLDQPSCSSISQDQLYNNNNNNITSIIFHTCYFIAISTSNPLLRSAATDTLSHVILHVCTYTTKNNKNAETLVLIISTLASQLNNDPISNKTNDKKHKQKSNSSGLASSFPHHTTMMPLTDINNQNRNTAKRKKKQSQDIQLALSLMNIVFETADSKIFQTQENLLELLQNTVCRYLLQLSTTQNLVTYSLTLRVIFNLFQNLPKNVMFKRLLEIFVTSIHLKILSPTSSTFSNDPRQIVALESLLEFCREPSLIQDIYCNYDCDVQCTNLFENICTTLYQVASPTTANNSQQNVQNKDNDDDPDEEDDYENIEEELPQFTTLNKLAYDGIFSILHSIDKRCQNNSQTQHTDKNQTLTTSNDLKEPETTDIIQQQQSMESNGDDIYENFLLNPSCTESDDSDNEDTITQDALSSSGSIALSLDGQRLLMERKRQKKLVYEVVKKFNASSKEWITLGQDLQLFPTPITAEAVAKFLFYTPNLSKTLLGEYLSKGPHEKYPFHKSILEEFCQLYSFQSLSFCDALRTYLIRFRLPGEAQCIDRLMEAFAKELYRQQKQNDQISDTLQENERTKDNVVKCPTEQNVPDQSEPLQTVVLRTDESMSVVSSINTETFVKEEYSIKNDEGLASYSVHEQDEGSSSPNSLTASISSESNRHEESLGNHETNENNGRSGVNETDGISKNPDTYNENEEVVIIESIVDNDDMTQEEESDVYIAKFPLKSSDAAFVLAFSTIMLNTDLHNPTIADDRRMTLKQFINNNRGINEGENVPKAFLTQLYNDIQQTQLQIHPTDTQSEQHDIDQSHHFNDQMAKPCFTVSNQLQSDKRNILNQAGLQDADMFSTISPLAINCIHSIWLYSSDDILVWKAFQCMQHMIQISLYFSEQDTFNELLIILLQYAQDYISNVLSFAVLSQNQDNNAKGSTLNSPRNMDIKIESENKGDLFDFVAVPHDLRMSQRQNILEQFSLEKKNLEGCAIHIGYLCLDGAFVLVRLNKSEVTCWPEIWECLLGLYHLHVKLVELDDFADSRGNVLPLSIFALRSKRRLHEYYLHLSPSSSSNQSTTNKDGFLWKFSSLFQKEEEPEPAEDLDRCLDDEFEVTIEDSTIVPQREQDISDNNGMPPHIVCPANVSKALIDVVHSTNMRGLFLMNSDVLTCELIPQLLKYIISENDKDLSYEYCAVYALEVAVHALFNNTHHVQELYPLFETTFTSLLSDVTFHIGEKQYLKRPYLTERMVISILRFAIHFPHLSHLSFNCLEKILELPTIFLKHFVNRLSCGLAIILRVSHSHFKSVEEWTLMGDLLDRSAKFPSGRRFVFDGVASCVEDYIPSVEVYFSEKKNNEKDVGVTEDYKDEVSQEESENDDHEKTNENVQSKPVDEREMTCGDNKSDNELKENNVDKKDESNEHEETMIPSPITYEGAYMLTRLLLKFVFGSYGGDLSMSVPSMFCLEKTYWYLFHMAADQSADSSDMVLVPDEDLWNTVGSAMYSVALSPNPQVALEGIHCLDRFLTRTKFPAVSSTGWMTILETITSKLPPVSFNELRLKVTNLLGNLLLVLVPELCQEDKNIDALTDVVTLTADYVGENLRHMKQHHTDTKLLQESTVETFTKISNQLSLLPTDSSDFCWWTAEIFYRELDTLGLAADCNPSLVDHVQQKNTSTEDPANSNKKYWV